MGRRKGRKFIRDLSPSWLENYTGAAGEPPSPVVPREYQIGPIFSFLPLPHVSSPKSKSASPPSSPASSSNLETLASTAASGKSQSPAGAASSKSVASVPNASKKTKEKPKEKPDSPLPLICFTRSLKDINHCPHFLPMREHTGIVRQQLESAWDRVFIETANQIQGLKSKDVWVNGVELWKATADLQTMGYDLIPLRRRLLEIRDKVLESERAETKLLQLELEAMDISEEMDRLKEEIKKIGLLHEGVQLKRLIGQMEAERMKKKLPKYNNLMYDLASKPFGPGDCVDNELGLMRWKLRDEKGNA